MHKTRWMKCPGCDGEMEAGFSNRSSALAFVSAERVKEFVHREEDLNHAGWRTIFPSRARYNAAYRCCACSILVVDYGKAISYREAKGEAA